MNSCKRVVSERVGDCYYEIKHPSGLSLIHISLIIDLASAPGGIDREISEKLGIKTVQALSLPGKVAPKTAGEIIKTTIYNMMEE